MNGTNRAGRRVCACVAGRLRVTIGDETVEASPDFWRAVLFDMRVREDLRADVSRDLVEPVPSGIWWQGDNGDGR